MNSVNLGQPILWNKIVGSFIGPDAIHCPSGGDYLLSPLNPDVGQLAATCPHPEHQDDITKEAKKNEW